jgi:hypothetical protein
MKIKFKIIFVLLLMLSLFACKKDEIPDNGSSQELVFHSLIADSDTIAAGTSTTIRASVEGYLLTYYWSASAGSLLGGGNEVTFVTSPCLQGKYAINCEVKDGNNKSESKTIYVVVE